MTKTYCDICGKEIKTAKERIEIHYVVANDDETISQKWYELHEAHLAKIVAEIENLFVREQKQ